VTQRILILGGDGYLGWPTAMALSRAGHDVHLVDNFAKRQWEQEIGVRPLFGIPTLHERIRAWREVTELDYDILHVDAPRHGPRPPRLPPQRPAPAVRHIRLKRR